MYDVEHLCIHEDKLPKEIIFRFRAWTRKVIVTQQFVDIAIAHSLLGFSFQKIWPLPKSRLWKDERLIELDGGITRDIAKYTLVIILPSRVGKGKRVAPKLEKDAVDSLDDALCRSKAFVGSLYGTDHDHDALRIFIQCGNFDKVLKVVRPWASQLSWPSSIEILKKYSEVFDEKGRVEQA